MLLRSSGKRTTQRLSKNGARERISVSDSQNRIMCALDAILVHLYIPCAPPPVVMSDWHGAGASLKGVRQTCVPCHTVSTTRASLGRILLEERSRTCCVQTLPCAPGLCDSTRALHGMARHGIAHWHCSAEVFRRPTSLHLPQRCGIRLWVCMDTHSVEQAASS